MASQSASFSTESANLRLWVIVAYVLHLVGLSLIGVILNYVKRKDGDSLFRGHHEWMIRTFWWTVILGILGAILSLIGIGVLLLMALGVWYYYRLIKGLVLIVDSRPIEDPKRFF